jgi:hypothetical protein
MQKWLPNKVSADELAQYQLLTHTHNEREQQEYLARLGIRISLYERQMYTFNVAQQELGYIKADDLFKKASLEGIFKNPYKFLTFTFIRMLAQLDVYSPKDLSHPDYYLQKARFCYTQKEQDMEKPREWAYRRLSFWKPPPYNVPSPLQWERKVLLGKVYRLFNFTSEAPTLPDSCQIKPNFMIKDGQIYKLNCGDCVMTERLWTCRDLDVYFFSINVDIFHYRYFYYKKSLAYKISLSSIMYHFVSGNNSSCF